MSDAQVPNYPQDERVSGATGRNAIQSITVFAKKGKFTVTYEDVTTGELAFNLTAAELKTALEALSDTLFGNIAVSGGVGDEKGTKPYVIEFINSLAKKPVPAFAATSKSLEEGSPESKVTVTQTQTGKTAAESNATQKGTGLADRTQEPNPLDSESPVERRTNHSSEFD